ncbi:protein fem-1 homolog A-like isoform X2 [Macrobrachium nipponense]|uniref:protein fem-1 homolog A-like isoform X2 n=1 Tax=Macrobrachium nipponense TaxID=159736 RepID=UPI0030C81E6D
MYVCMYVLKFLCFAVTIGGRFLHGVRPLWCAAVGGQYAVIDYLLSKGANVNGITRFKSTPLRAACIHGHLDIAKLLVEHGASTETTDPYSFTCLMLAAHNCRLEIVKYLLEIGVDVNGKSIDGQSALHVSAEMGHIEIMKVLLDHSGQMDADISGNTPLILASFRCHVEMVEYLVSRTDLISVKEKADAFELLGASLFDDMEDIVGVIQYWKSAMSHRYVDGVLTYPKSELNLEGPAHEEFREVTTLEQLEALETDFESVQRQSLLVKERVLGPDHFTTMLYIRDAGLDYANDGAFKQCINLWVHAIEVQYFRLKPLNHARLYHFRSFLGLFSSLTDAEHVSNWNCQPKDFFDDIMCVFEKGARELNLVVSELDQSDISVKKLNESHLNECVAIIMHLLVSLTMLQPQLSSSQIHTFRSALYQLLKKDPRDAAGWSLLHIACCRSFKLMDGFSVPVSSTPRKTVIDLLLDTGADPFATDKEGNTPLHTLAKNEDCSKGMVESLLRAGAHLDAMNSRRQTFWSLRGSREPVLSKAKVLSHTSLQCLAATCIREHGIPYKGILHPRLEKFVDMH